MNLFQNDCITLVSCNHALMYARNLVFNIMYSMCNIKNCKFKCTRNLMAESLIRYQTICTSFLRNLNVFCGIVSVSFTLKSTIKSFLRYVKAEGDGWQIIEDLFIILPILSCLFYSSKLMGVLKLLYKFPKIIILQCISYSLLCGHTVQM